MARFSNWPTHAEGKDRTAVGPFPEKLSAMDRREFLEPGTRSKSFAAIFPLLVIPPPNCGREN